MKSLELNPQKYEITLSTYNDAKSDGYAEVNYRFAEGHTRQTAALYAEEAAKIGAWFTALSKKLAKYESRYDE